MKEMIEAIEKGNLYFGLKETLKSIKKSKSSKKNKIFVVNDAREETIKKLSEAGLEFSKIKSREDISKDLNLDFECEVFLIK